MEGMPYAAESNLLDVPWPDIEQTMENIDSWAEVAADGRLSASGFQYNHPTVLDVEIFNERLIGLLRHCFAKPFLEVRRYVEQLNSIQSQQPLQLRMFIRGLIGCAVWKWVLEKDLVCAS